MNQIMQFRIWKLYERCITYGEALRHKSMEKELGP